MTVAVQFQKYLRAKQAQKRYLPPFKQFELKIEKQGN